MGNVSKVQVSFDTESTRLLRRIANALETPKEAEIPPRLVDAIINRARNEVRKEVEKNFTNIGLTDLFNLKGWEIDGN